MDLRLDQQRTRYVRDARLARDGAGLALHCLASDGAEDRWLSFDLRGGALGEPSCRAAAASIMGLTTDDVPRLAGLDEIDRVARAGDEVVRVVVVDGRSEVRLERAGAAPVVVFAAHATAAAPALAVDRDGTWVAFHHNLREDTLEADLTKWIALRFVDRDARVWMPSAPMLDRDRDREGEEQGFEFPTLVRGPGGAITLFGRGSHAFYRQDLDETGWHGRIALGEGEWGCRGRRIAAIEGEGGLVIAYRERAGIRVRSLEEARGGRPRLEPAPTVMEARAHRDRPARPSGIDPASRWERRTLFGDIHQHSAHSDGCGSAHEPFLRARHAYGDDFVALSDHESFLGKRILAGEWDYLRAVADEHDEPGRFATLHAYEWTGKMYPGPGHKVVYPRSAAHRVVSRDDVPTGIELTRRLREERALAVPHHVGWTGADVEAHDPSVQPVWEICSCHGCYLHADHPLGARGDLRDQMIESVLSRGLRFGFIACSDGHGLLRHHGVARKRDSFRTGLTAVQATDCTREAILDALVARRCYATSGVPIWLDLDADGAPMGSALESDGATLRVRARGATPLASIALVGASGVLAESPIDGEEGALEADVRSTPWCYARVVQRDGEMAWSSPVFFDGAAR